jgi:hypothetical protein
VIVKLDAMLLVENINGNRRVVADKRIEKEQILLSLRGILKSFPNKYSIQINRDNHLHPFSEDALEMQYLIWPYLNHSCNSNAYMDVNALQLIALKDINPQEEITFDYELTEWEIKEPFECDCKSENCRKKIIGKKYYSLLSTDSF